MVPLTRVLVPFADPDPFGCGSKLNRRVAQVLVNVSTYQHKPFWYRLFEPQPFLIPWEPASKVVPLRDTRFSASMKPRHADVVPIRRLAARRLHGP